MRKKIILFFIWYNFKNTFFDVFFWEGGGGMTPSGDLYDNYIYIT